MRAFVAMSGGVDSAACAILLQAQGFEVEGITMVAHPFEEAASAARTCETLSIPHHVIDLQQAFARHVSGPFAADYLAGLTPNPCVVCNREIKFGALFDAAIGLGAEVFATGHYATVAKEGDGYILKKALDGKKDQSYMLFSLNQQKLSKILLPLGDKTKEEIRRIAKNGGLEALSQSAESQDICFIPEGDYGGYIKRQGMEEGAPGDFVHVDGTILGRHRGIVNYTVGQRKGLGVAYGYPLYVVEKNLEKNTVILGPHESIFKDSILVKDVNWVSGAPPSSPIFAAVQTRYHGIETAAEITHTGGGVWRVEFEAPVRAPAPGQAAVFYKGDILLGGGIIL